MAGPWLLPAESVGVQGGFWWKLRLYSLVQQEQLLMTFRKKLMMRNASWHFRSSSQQPGEHSVEQRAGMGGQEINFAVSIVSRLSSLCH